MGFATAVHGQAASAAMPVVPNPALAVPLPVCIAELRREVRSHPEVRAETFDAYTRDVQDLRPVIDSASRSQPEFELPIWDYLARLADAKRASQGAELLVRETEALATVRRRYGVDPAIAVAVFGVETDYGRVAGRYPVIDATLSRACLNLKSDERKQHFFAALRLVQDGTVKLEQFKGSWAGAFGMTQFMPGTFVRVMNDAEGEPAADIVNSVGDALLTTARYLKSLGWREGLAWGVEVQVPNALGEANALQSDHGCLAATAAPGKCRTVAQWVEAGVTRAGGAPWSASPSTTRGAQNAASASIGVLGPQAAELAPLTRTALLMPAGVEGPAWLVTANYQAIWRYNRADAYALAIGLIADTLRGVAPPSKAWPTDDPGLSRGEFAELQSLLLALGHCDVKPDGADGPRTRAAIVDEEARAGRASKGRGGVRLLAELRKRGRSDASCGAAPITAASASSPAR